jgi:hypothetical protein
MDIYSGVVRLTNASFMNLGTLRGLSTLHVLVLSQAPLDMIQFAYYKDAGAKTTVTGELIRDACKFGVRPEVLRFLIDNMEPKAPWSDTRLISFVLVTLMTQDETDEQLIKNLVELYPESTVFCDGIRPSPLSLCLCLKKVSLELTKFIVSRLPDTMEEFTLLDSRSLREKVGAKGGDFREHICLKTLATILTKAADFTCRWMEWSSQDFATLVHLLLRRTSTAHTMHSLHLCFPPCPVPWPQLLQSSGSSNRIDDLNLTFTNDTQYAFLAWVQRLERLVYLFLTLTDQATANQEFCNSVVQVLGNRTLEWLRISCDVGTGGRLRPIIAEVGRTPSVSMIDFYIQDSPEEKLAYKNHIVHLLQENTTLKAVFVGGPDDDQDSSLYLGDSFEPINYYTTLNSLGRGLARDPNAPMFALVEKLAAVTKDRRLRSMENEKGKWGLAAVLYGLLRESPGYWSKPGFCQSAGKAPRGRKRKCA